MEYPELIESCKKAIKNRRCLGCTALEDYSFKGNSNCKFGKTLTVQESIEIIHRNLGMGEQMKIW